MLQILGTEEAPFNNIYKALLASVNGDTIYLKNGFYGRDQIGIPSNYNINISVNIIAESKNGVILSMADNLSFSQNSTYNNVYEASRSSVANVIDLRIKSRGLYPELNKAISIEECSQISNSWYTDGDYVYVNIGEDPTNKVSCQLIVGNQYFKFIPNNANINIYIENLVCLGGAYGMIYSHNTGNYIPTIVCNNCDFLYNTSNKDAVEIIGSNSIMYKCKACFSAKDGFNYHADGSHKCNSIEIDCIGSYNGYGSDNNTNNGSTTHDGNKVLRINGTYFCNKGPNIADINANTDSININCTCYDSLSIVSSTGTSKSDFNTQDEGCNMYLYNCKSKGSKSNYNLVASVNSTIRVSNSEYTTTQGNVIEI